MASRSVSPIYRSFFNSTMFEPEIAKKIEGYAGDGSTTQIALARYACDRLKPRIAAMSRREPSLVKPTKILSAIKMARGSARRADAFAYEIAMEVLKGNPRSHNHKRLEIEIGVDIEEAIEEAFNIPIEFNEGDLQRSANRLRELSSFATRFGFSKALHSCSMKRSQLINGSLEEGAEFALLLLELGFSIERSSVLMNACFKGSITQENQKYKELILKLIALQAPDPEMFADALLMRDEEIMEAVIAKYHYLENKGVASCIVQGVLQTLALFKNGTTHGKEWFISVLRFILPYVTAIAGATDFEETPYIGIKSLQEIYPDDPEYQQALAAVGEVITAAQAKPFSFGYRGSSN